ncbi:hypothetical protein [Hydrogenophaga laconesensis]|uniref:Uncharacterized protein n=1 Tax=Hydrogenophaga laconesensis TaxID=1805971 RepID=A0ABU1V9K2_9BURK|nr:hypothetical protein [Hydrogenophaga laconesensis]MDR7094139.1 hypothetical protein [Hydrogenophaga laconesensis]
MPFYQAEQVGRQTAEYKRVMTLVFGEDWQAVHESVKAYREKMNGGKQ